MSDADLLRALVEMFEGGRREAEHFAQCEVCDPPGSEDPYRCAANPVARREALSQWVMRRRRKVVWALQGFPPRTLMEQAEYDLFSQYTKLFLRENERRAEMMSWRDGATMKYGGTVTFPIR